MPVLLLLLLLCLIECKIHTHNPLFILLLLFERPFLNNIQDLKGKEIDFLFSYLRVRQLLAVAEILELSRGSAAVGGVDYKSKKRFLYVWCRLSSTGHRRQTAHDPLVVLVGGIEKSVDAMVTLR